MKVIINYIDGNKHVYDNCDDIDVDPDYIDIYPDPTEYGDSCIGLDLNLVKSVFTETILPDGTLDVNRVFFNKKSAKINSKKEVSNMNTTEETKVTEVTEEAAEEVTEAVTAPAADEADDFDFAEEYNHKGNIFTIDTSSHEGHKAAEIYAEIGDAPLLMKAIFVNKDTGIGESVSVVTPNCIIYFGKTNVEKARNIRENEKAVAKLNSSGAYFRIRQFEPKNKKFKNKGYSFEFLRKDEIPADFPDDAPCFKW